MKKLLILSAMVAMFAACGTRTATTDEVVTDTTAVDTVEVVDVVEVDTVVAE